MSSFRNNAPNAWREFADRPPRDEMKFDGFVIGDWNGHAEIPGCTLNRLPDALLAGYVYGT